jgi:hypothetical protein
MEEKQNINVMAADLDNVLQRNFSFSMDSEISATKQIQKTHQQARKKFVVKINLITSRYI